MNASHTHTSSRRSARCLSAWLAFIACLFWMLSQGAAQASIAYGSINNFDTVNDTGHECHGFEIEIEDCTSTAITYTYNYNHYGAPKITQDDSIAGHPKCTIRWESKKNANGTWAAYTAIPSGPINPTNGHMFTNPSVNFGGEHFGVGYNKAVGPIHYNWLIDDGAGNLVHGGVVQVSTPVFNYFPPVVGNPAPPQVQAVIAPPPPPAPEPKEFGKAVWMKEIKTTTHNNKEVKLRDLVSDDPVNPDDKNWKNGEPDEVEVEWRILQKRYSQPDGGPNNEVPAAPEDLPGGDEVVTRRYEFFKYTGPLDEESGEAVADVVDADGLHGSGMRTYNHHMVGGEWVKVTEDMATFEVIGDFTGSQMAAVDVDAPIGLIDHVGEGKVNVDFADRTVVVEGAVPLLNITKEGALPAGMAFDLNTGVLSGTPTVSGEFNFKITASDGASPDVSKNYTLVVAPANAPAPPASLLDTIASPLGSGTTTGDGAYAVDANATVTAVAAAGFAFVNWTDNGVVVSTNSSHTLVMNVNHSLVANFLPTYTVTAGALPVEGGTTTGGGTFNEGASVTVTATANPGYAFTSWTEDGFIVSAAPSLTFNVASNRTLVANFTQGTSYTVSTSASPAAGGGTSGGGVFASGSSVTVNAAPNAGYVFTNWTQSGTVVSSSPGYTFNVTADRILVANFIPNVSQCTIATSANPALGGSTSGGGTVAVGSSVTVAAAANAGYSFVNWTEAGNPVSASASYTFNATVSRALVANFQAIAGGDRTITTTSSPVAGGTTSGGGVYADGTSITVTAVPNAGYIFKRWRVGGTNVSSSASYTFTVTADRALTATFAPVATITTASAPANAGTTSGGGQFEDGDNVTVQAFANDGFTFVNWTQNGTVVSVDAAFTFKARPDTAPVRNLVANFNGGVSHTINASAVPVAGGTTSGGGAVADGSNVTLMATANAGYTFVNWTEAGAPVSASASYTFTATSSRTLVANFIAGYSITTSASPSIGGTTSGGGVVNAGTSVTLVATANPGYTFTNWTDSIGTEVSTLASYTFTPAASGSYVANFTPPPLGIHFDFDTGTPELLVDMVVPLDQTSVGITASFDSPVASGFTVQTEASSGRTLSLFSGKYLASTADGAVLHLYFSQPVTGVSLDFATVEALNVPVASTVKIIAIDNSSGVPVQVGTGIAHGTVTAGDSLPVGTINFNSAAGAFDQIILQLSDAPVGALRFLVDNITVSPSASTGGSMLLANPNWNITLTDFGYSDFLLDNTPGFEGREYLSGEWGSAVAYQRTGHTQRPTWLEPNFLFPDWKTNSDFTVVEGIHLIGNNLDGLPIAQSIISNGDLEITLRFEMIDTVTGTPMGVKPASAAGAATPVNSNRYVMNQTFTVKNISGVPVTNVQLYHLLHGFISQHGQYDNRSYPGKLTEYQYDMTMSGVDAGAAGDQSSTVGLEDLIGFHSKVAPSAFEIGHYGIEGNGIDDHSVGKPSDGVHLSIENNWESAPYLARKNRDNFAPADRWISGAQRWELGSIAPGQSVNLDIVLSLLTGTKVVVDGGGSSGTGGHGSCNGGSSHAGGVDFEFEDIDQEGTFFGEYSEADDNEMLERENEGEFTLPAFQTPNGTLQQRWNLKYSGSHTGNIKLKFAYDPALLPAGYDENQLVIYHFNNGVWEKLPCKVDPVNNIIEAITPSLSPFMLGVNDVVVTPKVEASVTTPNTLSVSWPDTFTGWVLQESAGLNPAAWVNSTRPVTSVGGVSSVSVPLDSGARFFRLIKP